MGLSGSKHKVCLKATDDVMQRDNNDTFKVAVFRSDQNSQINSATPHHVTHQTTTQRLLKVNSSATRPISYTIAGLHDFALQWHTDSGCGVKTRENVIYFFSDSVKMATNGNRELEKSLYYTNNMVDKIIPTLRCFITKNNEGNPVDIVKLKLVAKDESLWINIIVRLIDKIELIDQFGPSIIAIFLEETPLPSKEQISHLADLIILHNLAYCSKIKRNIFVILCFLCQKVAGTNIASTLIEKTADFTLSCLRNAPQLETSEYQVNQNNENKKDELNVLLFAMIALEKFSMSTQNTFLMKQLLNADYNPLVYLTKWQTNSNTFQRQIGFLAQHLLDNIFTPEKHIYGYLQLSDSLINVRLDDEDTSEYLKISPNGLEARNDTLSFESVRSTMNVDEGVWFYEVTLLTNGIMQIGFATKSASFLNQQGCGIGDDQYSVGYDGCRNLIWFNAQQQSIKQETWKEGDVIGFLLDITERQISFYHNGRLLTPVHTEIFRNVSKGFYPAASFMSFQHAIFNFGHEKFKYPPDFCSFSNFNEHGKLEMGKQFVLPRRQKLELIRQLSVKEDACSLCCANISNVILLPCKHDAYCDTCALRLTSCPICRSAIVSFDSR